MIISVKNICRRSFHRLNFYPTSENPTKTTHAYISIRGSEFDEIAPPRVNLPLWYKGLMLVFDDVDTTDLRIIRDLNPITQDQCEEIINFVLDLHRDPLELNLIIHCFAGVSRSAGVGMWVNDAFKLHLPNYSSNMLYNRFVYRQLSLCWDRLNTVE